MQQLRSLGDFVAEKVLSEDAERASVVLQGSFRGREQEGRALLVLQRTAFSEDDRKVLLSSRVSLQRSLSNDVYSYYTAQIDGLTVAKVDVIFPASDAEVARHTEQGKHAVLETADEFLRVHRPYIEAIPTKTLQWVRNILEGSAEADRVLFSDPDPDSGFMLLPHNAYHPGRNPLHELRCLAIVRAQGLCCLRDLTGQHLSLLRNIRRAVPDALQRRFGLSPDQLFLFFHYPPSFYHLHVHVYHVSMMSSSSASASRAYLLDDVVWQLENDPRAMQKRPLSMILGSMHPLRAALVEYRRGLSGQNAGPR